MVPQGDGLRYAVALREARDIASGESRVKRASASLSGSVALNGRDTLPAMIEQLTASGIARVDGVSVPGASVSAVVVMIGRAPPGAHDRSGTIQLSALAQTTPQASGWVRVQAADVRAADEHIRGVDVYLRLEQGWGFEVIGEVMGRRRAPSNLKINALGNLQDNFQALALREARLTLPDGRAWTVAASRVDLRGGGVVIDGLKLTQPMPQGLPNGSLSVEGGYRPRGKQDLKVEARAISLGQALNDFGVAHLAPEVFGELEVGTEAQPFTHNATITLTDNVKDEELMGMGDRGIMLSGGTLNLHGNRSNAWTKLAATAEAGSDHPLGRPIVEAGRRHGPLPAPETLDEHAGLGISARIDGREVAAGNRRLMEKLGIPLGTEGEAGLERLLEAGQTPILVAADGRLVGLLGMSDMAREGARLALTDINLEGADALAAAINAEVADAAFAWHEAGHALAALKLPNVGDPVSVTIIPRGVSGGATWMDGSDDDFLTRSEAEASLVVKMSGRSAGSWP